MLQSAWASAIKSNSFIEANIMNMSANFQLHPPYDFWGEDFWIFVRKFTFYVARQPIRFSDLDKILMTRRGLLKKHFCKKNLNICSEAAKVANFHFSHYKSMETISCHRNQSFYPIGTKNLFLSPLPIDAMCKILQESASWLQRRCRLKMLTTDDWRRRTDACLYYKLTYEPKRWAKI